MVRIPDVNLDDAESGYKLLQPGVIGFVVKSVKTNKAKSSGEAVLDFEVEVLDGPDAGEKSLLRLSLQKQALWRMREFRDACGVQSTGDFIETDDFVGARFRSSISQKEVVNQKTQKTELRTNFEDFMAYQPA
jgi:hypothetical protein